MRSLFVVLLFVITFSVVNTAMAYEICFGEYDQQDNFKAYIGGVQVTLISKQTGESIGTLYTPSTKRSCLSDSDFNINAKACYIVEWFKEGYKTHSHMWNPSNELRKKYEWCADPENPGGGVVYNLERY